MEKSILGSLGMSAEREGNPQQVACYGAGDEAGGWTERNGGRGRFCS